MAGRLDDGLRSEIKGEIKAWSADLAWHLEVGGRAAHGSDVRERRCLCQSAQSQREYAFRQIRQRGLGRVGQVGRARARWPMGEVAGSDKF
jgi:hypothetical protein